jgi:hypothetical protein
LARGGNGTTLERWTGVGDERGIRLRERET